MSHILMHFLFFRLFALLIWLLLLFLTWFFWDCAGWKLILNFQRPGELDDLFTFSHINNWLELLICEGHATISVVESLAGGSSWVLSKVKTTSWSQMFWLVEGDLKTPQHSWCLQHVSKQWQNNHYPLTRPSVLQNG